MKWAIALLVALGLALPAAARPFDPTKDHERVLECYAAHFHVAIIGGEILKLPPAQIKPEEERALWRQSALRPYVEHYTARGENVTREAATLSADWRQSARLQALIPGRSAAIFAAAVERSRACDVTVQDWKASKH